LRTSISSSQTLSFISSSGARQGSVVIGPRVGVGVNELSPRSSLPIFTTRLVYPSHHPSFTRIEPPHGFTYTQKICHISHNPRRKSPRPHRCQRTSASAKVNTAISASHNSQPQTAPTPSAPQDYASRTVAGAT
jgi:hypothetical protein